MSDMTVDIQKITEEIKAELKEKELVNDIPSFDEVVSYTTMQPSGDIYFELKRDLNYLKHREVHYFRDISSYHKGLAPIVTFVKRVIRKLCRFLGEPMVDEINDYHDHLLKIIDRMAKAMEHSGSLPEHLVSYEEQIMDEHKYRLLAEQYATENYHLKKDVQALQKQMQDLQMQYEQLKLQSERAELKADIAKLRTEKE